MSPPTQRDERFLNPFHGEVSMSSVSNFLSNVSGLDVSAASASSASTGTDAAPAAAPPEGMPTSVGDLFQRIIHEAMGLPESQLRAIDTDVFLVASGVEERHPKLLELYPRFVHHRCPLWGITNILGYATVARDLHAGYERTKGANPEDARLLDASVPLLKRFKGDIALLVARNRVKPAELAGLDSRKSFRNNSEASMRYARLLEREFAYLIDCKSTVTQEDITQLYDLSRRLSAIVSERETHAKQDAKARLAPPNDMQTRTFTLLDKAMDEVRGVLTFLLMETPDAMDLYLPSKPKKPSANKTSPGRVKAEAPKKEATPKKEANAEAPKDAPSTPTPSANGNVPAPVPTSSGNIPAPAREEVRAAE